MVQGEMKTDTPLMDKFLKLYSASQSSSDIALRIVMERNKVAIEPLFEAKDPFWLHKAFRQVDVCESSSEDALIWHLIHASRDFWDTLAFFWNDVLDKRNERRSLALVAEVKQHNAEIVNVLLRARDAIEALDGTSVENERLVDDYRTVVTKATGV